MLLIAFLPPTHIIISLYLTMSFWSQSVAACPVLQPPSNFLKSPGQLFHRLSYNVELPGLSLMSSLIPCIFCKPEI